MAYRITLFAAASILLVIALFYTGSPAPLPAPPDTLPTRLSNKEFWRMITDFSEADGYFRSDNFVSNESGYQRVIPLLKQRVRSGGVYLGVGPEQNLTYIVGLQPKMAFIVDIRRQNMLEHLLYKTLMELSADRADFLSRLLSRPRPKGLDANSTADALVRAYQRVEADPELLDSNLKSVLDFLEKARGFSLSAEDEDRIRYVYRAFFDSGLDLRFTFAGGYGGFYGMPAYGDLMTENDGHSRNWNFLATEHQYRAVQRMQQKNLIVPLVGNFAGPKAIRSVAEYLKQHGALLTAFYTSNVEQYLFQDDNDWTRFYENVAALPVDSSSVFIRYVLNSWGVSRRSRTVFSPIDEVVRAYNHGRIRSYYDIVEMSR